MFNFLNKYFCLENKYLIQNLIQRNMKIRYRGSWLGVLWTVLIPAMTSLVYFIIFKFILRVSIPNYLLIIFSGLIPWTFLSQTLVSGVESLVANQSLLNKVPLRPNSLTLSEGITYFINLMLSLPVLIAAMLYYKVPISFYTIQYFIFLGLLFLFTYSLSIILSYGFVYFRDLKFLLGIILQFWFYLTPIMYDKNLIPEKYFNLIYLNPLGPIFLGFHDSILNPDFVNTNYYLAAIAWLMVLIPISYFLTKKSNVVEFL